MSIDPQTPVGPRTFGWRGVRMRSALAAVLVVAIALSVGAALLFILLQRSLIGSVRTSALDRARQVAVQVRTDGTQGLRANLEESGAPSQVVQVLGPDGGVVAASSVRASHEALMRLRPAPGSTSTRNVARLPTMDPDEQYLLVARGVARAGQTFVVLVASPISAQQETSAKLATYLVLGLPALLLVVGATTFGFVGASLRPVERIRRRVAGIGAHDLADRVPVPASGDEIARLAMTMNEMLDRLHLAQENQRRFVADASHELRSPLATIQAGLDVAAADASGTTFHDLHPAMVSEAMRMQLLLQDLLLLARADEGGLNFEPVDVDLDDLLEAEVRRLRTTTALTITSRITPARCHGDPEKLRQVLRNLTDNAARYAGKRVHLNLTVLPHAAVVQVDDDGPGIPAGDCTRVFDRFVRLDSSRHRTSGGSGLGLAIAAEIARAHDGSLVAEESAWGGARLTFVLPLA